MKKYPGIKKYIVILLAVLFLIPSFNLQSQSLKAYEKAGDDAFQKKEYYNAVHYYDIVLKSKKTTRLYYKYAESCRLSHAYQAAETAYQKVVESREKRRFPMVEFYYGITLKHNAKYLEAKRAFQYFLKRYRRDNFYKAKANQELLSCDFARQLVNKPIPEEELEIVHLNENVNTQYSDFGAHEVAGKLYYSSLRFDREREKGEKKEKDLHKRIISRLLSTTNYHKEKGKQIENLDIPHQHSANSTLSHDGKRLYFTRCSGKSSDSLRCELYYSDFLESGKWSKAVRLPNPINSNTSTTTHPNLEWHSDSESEWLYFTSNRSGGQGGMDIWRVELKEDLMECVPYNLGPVINSKDAEGTPFYDSKTNRLYFASRWHFGLGGYDIFYSEQDDEGNWSAPVNMGIPFNSAANDLYFVINIDDTTGYIASNREGSRSLTEESCCNDIYRYTYLKNAPALVIDTPDIVEVPVDTPDIVEVPVDTPDIVEVIYDTTVVVQKLDELLPICLYFHNDEPDSNVTLKFTTTPYEKSYAYYMSLVELYKNQYSSQFNSERAEIEKGLVQEFFDDRVKGEYERMQKFFEELLVVLSKKVKLKVFIKGYTSSRAKNNYNLALAHRRVSSLRNFLLSYKNGSFKPYLQNNQLIIEELMFGETLVPKSVADSFNDPRNSIYSVAASRERKAEISYLIRQK